MFLVMGRRGKTGNKKKRYVPGYRKKGKTGNKKKRYMPGYAKKEKN
ncbi:hypothetical protein M3204_11890 [Mesobacillus subterraneus]|nr:hypothetical protein [Mesobacillus subterraneus]MCM3665111.1 hypothetical protein [Mesobacillus subterraneus]MCM3684124.1 hypothetical protein [Mesobacillus subterraneus]